MRHIGIHNCSHGTGKESESRQSRVDQNCLCHISLHGSQTAQIKFQAAHKSLAFSLFHVISSEKLFLACVHLQSSKILNTKHVIHFVLTEERKREKAGK